MIEIKRKNSSSIFGLDLLRGIAIILMIITHGYRLYVNKIDFSNPLNFEDRILNVFALIEPYTSALFLFLAGIGLTISFEKKRENWINDNFKKFIKIYLIGVIIFFAEKGIQFPDIVVSPNILAAISISLVFLSLLLHIKMGVLGGIIASAIITYYAEGIPITGINAGPSGLFPLIMFTLLGSLVWTHRQNLKLIYLIIAICGMFLFTKGDWTSSYASTYKLWDKGSHGIAYLQSLSNSTQFYNAKYWNHNLISVPRILFFLMISFLWSLKIHKNKINQYLQILGKHSLGSYVLHLSLIGLLDILSIYPANGIYCWALIAVLVAICIFYSILKEKPTFSNGENI